MKTITNEHGQEAKIDRDLYNELFGLHVGDWIMIENSGKLCSTHGTGQNYPGWVNGAEPDQNRPAKIIDITPINGNIEGCIIFQGGRSFVFDEMEYFRKATEEEVEKYLTTFEIGDWVIGVERYNPRSPNQIRSMKSEYSAVYESGYEDTVYRHNNTPFVRHVTPEEMKNVAKRPNNRVVLNEEYDAVIASNGGAIKIGCQTFRFEKVEELYNRMKDMQK